MSKRPSPAEQLRHIRSLGGKASMERRSLKERQDMGRKGGIEAAKTRAKTTTPKQRSAIARKAAKARWAKAG